MYSAVASSPTIRRTGSPGIKCTIRKLTTISAARIAKRLPRRRSRKRSQAATCVALLRPDRGEVYHVGRDQLEADSLARELRDDVRPQRQDVEVLQQRPLRLAPVFAAVGAIRQRRQGLPAGIEEFL